MRLHLNKTLRAALIAAITAVGTTLPQTYAAATVVTLGEIGTQASHDFVTDSYVLNATNSATCNLTDGSVLTMTTTTKFWGTKSDSTLTGTWTNSAALDDMNSTLGSGFVADDFSAGINYCFTAPGNQNSVALLSVDGSLYTADSSTITMYVTVAARGYTMNNFSVTGLTDATVSYATNGGDGFSSTAAFSDGAAAITMIKIEGTLNGSDIRMTSTTARNGWQTISYVINDAPAPVEDPVWNGTDQSHAWNTVTANWKDSTGETTFTSGKNAIFNSEAAYKQVGIDEAVQANKVTIDGAAYTFNIGADGSLTANKLTIAEGGSLVLGGTGVMDVSGAISLAEGAGLTVGENNTLKVVDGLQALLSGTGVDNRGTVEVANNVTIGDSLTSKIDGTVTVADGKKLTLGTTKDSHSIDLTSLDALVLGQGANIDTKALKVDINNLTANGSTLNMLDTKDKNQVGVDLKGTTKLEGNLTITSGWKYKVNIEKLAGTGSLELTGGSEEHRAVIGDVSINSLTVTDKMNNVDLTGTVALSGVLGVNGTTNVTGQNAMTVGGLTGSAALNVANGITFNVAEGGNYSYTGTLTVGGQIVKQGDGTQTISGTALHRTILAQAGTLVLNGNYDIDAITDSTVTNTTVDYEGNVSANGFHKSSGEITVYSAEGTLNLDAAHFMYASADVTEAVKTGNGKYTLSESTDMGTVYVTEGSLAIAHYVTPALTGVVLSNGTTVNMDAATTVALTLADGATATVNADEATTISSISGAAAKLVVTGDSVVTLASANAALTAAVEIGGTATVKLGNVNALGNTSGVTVLTGATLDVNGTKDQNTCIAVTLAGGTLTNTGNEASFGSKQLIKDLVVTQDSTVDAAANDFGVINGGFNTTTLALNATLEKVGSHDFHLANTTVTGAGAIKVTEGAVWFGRATNAGIGSYASNFIMNGGDIKGRLSLTDNITVTTAAEGSTFEATVANGGHTITYAGDYDLTVSGAISGNGGIVKDGTGTLTLSGTNTYTGTTMVNGGTLDIQGSIANSTVKVADDATLAGNTENISVGIASGKTATIAGDFTPKDSGVTFISDSGEVKVQNTGDAEITYGIDQKAAKVTADILVVDSETNVTVKNKVVVGDIGNLGEGGLTLTHVDVESLQGVHALNGALTLQNITEVVSLAEIEIASGRTVAVYKGAVADATQEGTVTITEKLMAGGGTLLANLEMADGSKLAVNGGGENALTLGSQFTIAEGALVRLDEATLAALDNLAVGESLPLIKALNQTTLGYGQDYAGTWYDAMFSRVDGEYSLAGDFQVYATPTGFGLTKVNNVPEPTTGTLSLLALAALAARRRRK